jgi:mannose-6-phosphate isomerase-like protein (cupin superfamily)
MAAKTKPAKTNTYRKGQSGVRPWGAWRVVDVGDGFTVKRIVVAPGQRLSLQRHFGRAEHWFVVAGTGKVTLGARTRRVRTGDAIDIPVRRAHRLENVGDVPLTLVEIQFGALLDEGDIERLADDYRRVGSGTKGRTRRVS